MNETGALAVITGAGLGMGRAIAVGLAEAGHRVAALDIRRDFAEETVELVRSAGGTAHAFTVDISDADAVEATQRDVSRTCGRPWIIVNNAGWEEIHPFMETSVEFRLKSISINLHGPMTVSQVFLRDVIAAEHGGRVVNIASDAGRVGSMGEVVYSAAKGGIIAFTKSLAREMARFGITANCVCPGPTDTPMLRSAPKKLTDALAKAIPMRRLGDPQDVMNAVRFFASNESGYMTGQTLSVSGGLTMAG